MKKGTKLLLVLLIFTVILSNLTLTVSAAELDTADMEAVTFLRENENANKLWNHLMEKGCSEWWAATTIGNSYVEHQLSSSINLDNYYIGAFQIFSKDFDLLADYIYENGYKYDSIVGQYEFLCLYRSSINGNIAKELTGLNVEELETNTEYIYDATSAAAYFSLGMEGCTCYSGITSGVGKINDKDWHDARCKDYTFPTGNYGTICIQHLEARIKYTQLAYDAFHQEETETIEEQTTTDEVEDTFVVYTDNITVEETTSSNNIVDVFKSYLFTISITPTQIFGLSIYSKIYNMY